MCLVRTAVIATSLTISGAASATDLPEEIVAKDETVVLEVHAVGLQIYECKADSAGKMTWQFREPIATLLRDGITIGRHYAGPTWEIEGSVVAGKEARFPSSGEPEAANDQGKAEQPQDSADASTGLPIAQTEVEGGQQEQPPSSNEPEYNNNEQPAKTIVRRPTK